MAVALSRVYVAAVPLRATAGPAQMAMSAAYSLRIWEFQHFMVLVGPSLTTPAEDFVVFDFQPQDPEDVFVALAALSGRPVAGVVRRRKLARPPRRRCWLVGYCEDDALEIASRFSHGWKTDLTVGSHDCRGYTNGNLLSVLAFHDRAAFNLMNRETVSGLVESLTGEKNVLKRLKSSSSRHS